MMISFENVSKRYKKADRPALEDITLDIDKGDFVFIVGASGSGKSTMIRLILKEEKVSAGDIHVLGYDLRAISSRRIPFYRRNLGVVFQDFRLLPSKTAYENISFALEVTGKSAGYIQEAVPDVLRLVGLDDKGDAMPHELSGGEQQRVAIARAVVTKPAILLADEPTGNLDPDTSAGIMSVLERINAGGTTVLMATHDTTIVNRMRRRVIQLENGHLVRDERDAGYLEESPVVAAAQASAAARAAHPETPAAAEPQRRRSAAPTFTAASLQSETKPAARGPQQADRGADASSERAQQPPKTQTSSQLPAQSGNPLPAQSGNPVEEARQFTTERIVIETEPVLDGSAPPQQVDHLPPRVRMPHQPTSNGTTATPQTDRPATQPTTAPRAAEPAQPETGRLELDAEEDIQVIAYESQPLTERLGLVGGSQPAPAPAERGAQQANDARSADGRVDDQPRGAQGDESEERR
ncbi:cell division ATP-binding protein FtsE [Pseudoclavibacter sp. CFCC 14310]|uniref:cell division ATP-binding protein FtsE n=1 Tax=Pseudoclavibacter sp. CFCC 14310 TaxID=2615180 RepID=UPI001CE422BF|nr:cell division ATP-binding protein FtsE [Pseudoclavibacter sp. CFCC 14310]